MSETDPIIQDMMELAEEWEDEAQQLKEKAVSQSEDYHAEGVVLERCARQLRELAQDNNEDSITESEHNLNGLAGRLWDMCYKPELDPDEWADRFTAETDVPDSAFGYREVYATDKHESAEDWVLEKLAEWVVNDEGVTRRCCSCNYEWTAEDFIERHRGPPSSRFGCPNCGESTATEVVGK